MFSPSFPGDTLSGFNGIVFASYYSVQVVLSTVFFVHVKVNYIFHHLLEAYHFCHLLEVYHFHHLLEAYHFCYLLEVYHFCHLQETFLVVSGVLLTSIQ